MKGLLNTISRLVLPASAPALVESRNAYERGDYATALNKLEPLVRQGDPLALNLLGDMYNSGEGVRQDCAEAARLYTKAAKAGCSDAQYNLGLMFGDGAGVPQDDVKSLTWLGLAEAEGHRQAAEEVEIVTSMMSPDEVEEARQTVGIWSTRYMKRPSRVGRMLDDFNWQRLFGRLPGGVRVQASSRR